MGLITGLLSLPFKAPMDGAFWIARKLSETAEQELNDPAALRRALAEAEQQLLAGELTEAEYDEIEEILLERLRISAP